ncbi:MAG TPA: TIGR03619 family F420-dependent LLM class oxidoreductase [Candidatus Binataceae bacterium]|nr:TIGR03619 family F420-dependent LLM class oxidoreductase [Candidatus Binataceae bacterium]
MKIGLFAMGIGVGARPLTVRRIAETAERTGFSTLWVGEHVVLFDHVDSKYPYSESGDFGVPGGSDWLDPFITLTYAGAITNRIRLATGICLLPEHNPIVLAKEIATLDKLCGGRFIFGVGIGWSAEEFAALGIPFERRAHRTVEYLKVMRKLWSEDVTTFHGEFVNLERARSYPKPAQGGRLQVWFGGESAPAMRRVAEHGTGWHAFNLDPDEAREKIQKLHSLMREKGRDSKEVEIAVSPFRKRVTIDDLKRYRDAGVDEIVIVTNPPENESETADWVERIAEKWIVPASKL